MVHLSWSSYLWHGMLLFCFPVMQHMDKVNLDSATDYLIYGTKADVKSDKTHELVLEKKLWEIKEVLLAQVVDTDTIFVLDADKRLLVTFFPTSWLSIIKKMSLTIFQLTLAPNLNSSKVSI